MEYELAKENKLRKQGDERLFDILVEDKDQQKDRRFTNYSETVPDSCSLLDKNHEIQDLLELSNEELRRQAILIQQVMCNIINI